MNGTGVYKSLDELDDQLGAAGVPHKYRPLECFKKLHGSIPDGKRRQQLFYPIMEWYLAKYGYAVRWDGVIARFPIQIGGLVYLGKALFVAGGELLTNFKYGVEGLPDSIADSLKIEEVRSVMERLAFGNRNFHSLYNLSIEEDCLKEAERDLVKRATCDLDNAAATLKHTGDTQTAVVQAHEAAEKFLKAALLKSGITRKPSSFGHDIPKAFQALLQKERRYSCLSLPIANLQKLAPDMELRYGSVPRSMEMAIQAYHGALYVCGIIAQMWLFDKARGTSKSEFKECCFYLDRANSTYYCKKAQGESVTLTYFTSSEKIGTHMADIALDTIQSALYLEVKDLARDAQLRRQFLAQLRNPGRKLSAEEIGLKIVHGSEGSYATSMIRRPLRNPRNSRDTPPDK